MVFILWMAVLAVFILLPPLCFAEGTASGGYLAGYENAEPRPTGVSWWSTFAYLLSLLAVFAFVVVMAYLAARFLGSRFGQGLSSGGQILEHLPLGPNRSVCVVELADRVLMLGVTEHSITLLCEITDAEEIERLRRMSLGSLPISGGGLFSQQFSSLEELARRLPSMFKNGANRR